MEILAFFPAVLIGTALVMAIFPQLGLKGVYGIFAVCLGAGIGLGITSSTIFLWLAWIGRPGTDYIAFEIGCAAFLSAIAFYRFRKCRSGEQNSPPFQIAASDYPIRWLKKLVIILLVISSGSFALKSFFEMP